jgi:isopentenyldiphosphate isomerase
MRQLSLFYFSVIFSHITSTMPEELLEITNEQGEPTGKVVPRAEAHARHLWHNVTAVWVINDQGNILCNQLGNTKDLSLRGRWSTTVGGHLAPGESLYTNVVREIKEELGVTITADDLTFVCSRQSPRYSHIQNVFIWKCNLPITAFTIDNDEITSLRWIAKDAYLRDYSQGLFNNTLIDEIKEYLQRF